MPTAKRFLQLSLPALTLLSLYACTNSPPPQPGPDYSVVRFSHSNQDDVIGEKLDGRNTNDGRAFKVGAGAHDLIVMVQRRDPNGKMLDCFAKLKYANFRDGEMYNIHEERLGHQITMQLRHEKEVLATNNGQLTCMPGS